MKIEKIIIVGITILLTFFGLLLNASVITTNGTFFIKSVVIVGVGVFLFLFILRFFKYDYLKNDWLYIAGGIGLILLLVYILFAGKRINGAQRWLFIGPFSLQVSEFAKLYIILMVSYVIYRYHKNEIVQLIAYITVIFISVLVFFEPDLGMSVFLFLAGWLLFVVAGMFNKIKVKVSAGIFVSGLVIVLALYVFSGAFQKKVNSMLSYQVARLERFRELVFPYQVKFNLHKMQFKLEPIKIDLRGEYSEQSSKVRKAIENATWLGSGLSQGYYTKYLPAKHNDYIAVLALEELGIVGVTIMGLLYLVLFFTIAKISFSTESVFVHYVTLGIAFVIFIQALFHFGVNFQVLPEKGISLPLVSYGGSSYISNIIMIALVMKARVKG